ncbi:hypothetical protein LNGFDJGK_01907 [Enterobacter hormaechei]|nr:hypothetical protein LNGFDJGK_01907 [Enterobacter hormaechei]VAC87770.1 Uncharacterised protein [Enterobacter hormaechei]
MIKYSLIQISNLHNVRLKSMEVSCNINLTHEHLEPKPVNFVTSIKFI